MRRRWIPMIMFLAIMLVPTMALGAAFQGTIQGFTCVTQGQVCPIGKEDPMVAAESVFVLLTQPDVYYLVPNVDQKILARHIGEMVMIEGDVNTKYNSIKADNIYVMKDSKWRKVWSADLQDEIYGDILGSHPLKRGK